MCSHKKRLHLATPEGAKSPGANPQAGPQTSPKAYKDHNLDEAQLILLVVAILFLVKTLQMASITPLPILSVIFFALGIVQRSSGWLIPAGILGGIGAGKILAVSDVAASLPATADPDGLFLLAFAAGWVSVTLTSYLFAEKTHWWPLIPATVMAFSGLNALDWTPVALLAPLFTFVFSRSWLILGGLLIALYLYLEFIGAEDEEAGR